MRGDPDHVRLDGAGISLVFALVKGGGADIVHLGARLPDAEDLSALAAANTRGPHGSQPDVPPVPGTVPEAKHGWTGQAALIVSEAGGHEISTDLRLTNWDVGGATLTMRFADARLALELTQFWRICAGNVVETWCEVSATGHTLALHRIASIALPILARFTKMTTFSGRWLAEMHEHRRTIAPDGLAAQSCAGKPGFGGGNWLTLHDPATGEALGVHLAWSGDYDTRVDCDAPGSADGRAWLQMGARLRTGEFTLVPDAPFNTPKTVIALGADRSEMAQHYHGYARCDVLPDRKGWSPRRVHLNSWEALGFDLSEPALIELATSAAELGVERFVLDDGWFAGRRDDTTSLGDWTVSPDVFPNGLDPLIAHIHALGMDFGLWVEPEMVSPDSDLYRAHPEWCFNAHLPANPTMRGQLALDLTQPAVSEYLFAALDALLRDHAIAYLKWDHNRDVFPGGAYAQTPAVYALIDRLRAAHPGVEIESCASGGGRIDYGMLSRVHRVWPSDNNDPIERLRIMRAWSQFLPLEVLGSHVGPSPNPATGRRLEMDFRAKVALFGHMGVEADPRAMSEVERSVLATHIALYKDWREVLHWGDLWRLVHPDPGVSALMVTHGPKALALAAQTAFAAQFDVAPLRLKGLNPQAMYRVTLPEPWPLKAQAHLANPESWRAGIILSGTALMRQGLALPLTHPETAWLIALERLSE